MRHRLATPALVLVMLLLVIPAGISNAATAPPQSQYTEQAPQCVVPTLRGTTLRQAKTAITKAHCKLGIVKRRVAPKALVGKVVAQSPARGKRLKGGAPVNVTLGRAAS